MLLRFLLKLLKGAWRQNPKVTTVVAIGLVATTYFIVAFSITDRDNITDTDEQEQPLSSCLGNLSRIDGAGANHLLQRKAHKWLAG